ncbi:MULTISPECIES: branched-chain amino acid ABC transporter permease [Thermomonosporaceae]|uniref:branched-chain amino acid ABC transporter permease n=1 Tax=Thermomonosporaceae TaxID=2012 RepID=UPI00255AE59D|nr:MULTISPECIES: branched-chain amino acid ABC transporter permease [Thermomonosporaceae]MDL4774057.1 branched-chain amino acid ABC transporter permease [Actinomadura xylanilytica]
MTGITIAGGTGPAGRGGTGRATKAPPLRPQNRQLAILLVLLLVAIPLPLILPSAQGAVAVRILIFLLMAVGWNIMSGFGGMFSFGHAAYFGLGAYTSAYLLVEHGVSPWIGMLAGMAVAAGVAVVIGYFAFRYKLQGAYFALATFAFAEMLRLIVTSTEFTNKAVGFSVPLIQGSSLWKIQFAADSPAYFWIALALAGLAGAASILFLHSRSGRYVTAIRDDELAAASLGTPVMRHKLMTVALSAAITAVAGAFYTQYYLFVNPDLAFGSSVSIQAIATVVIGGIGTVWGPVVGAIIVGSLSDVTATLLRTPPDFLNFLQGRSGLDVALYAILLILIVRLLPKGIVGTAMARWRR